MSRCTRWPDQPSARLAYSIRTRYLRAVISRKVAIPVALLLGAVALFSARGQFAGGGGRPVRPRFGDFIGDSEAQREQEEMEAALKPGFKDDVFTFARLRYENIDYGRGRRSWDDDRPLADWNVAYRLFQVTSLKVRPGLNDIPVTLDEMQKYPFVYAAA